MSSIVVATVVVLVVSDRLEYLSSSNTFLTGEQNMVSKLQQKKLTNGLTV